MCIIGFGGTDMTRMVRARCSLEFKQDAVRPVRGGQSLSSIDKCVQAVELRRRKIGARLAQDVVDLPQ